MSEVFLWMRLPDAFTLASPIEVSEWVDSPGKQKYKLWQGKSLSSPPPYSYKKGTKSIFPAYSGGVIIDSWMRM